MSDIKVLRKLTKIFNELKKDDEEGHSSAYELQWEDIEAIENLIIENKKLKKQMGKDLDVVYIKGVYDERDKWKNKIKEKIRIRKEEKAECKDSNQAKLILREIYILQELIEGE